MSRRVAFTLIELLVVMVVIAILIGLAVPAAQRVREAARRTSSANNIRQMLHAMANYEAQFGHYPPSWKSTQPDASGNLNGWSTHALLLPFLEQDLVHSKIDFTTSYDEADQVLTADGQTTRLSALRVPTYLSPSEPRDEVRLENGEPKHYPLNYGVNLGTWLVYDPATKQGGNGAFFPNSRLRAADFRDGLTHTLAIAEVKGWQPYYRNAALSDPPIPQLPEEVSSLGGEFKSNSGHTEWVDGRAHQIGFTTTFRPNTKVLATVGGQTYDVDWTNQQEGRSTSVKTYAAITARGYYAGGVNVGMMGGTVRFIRDDIDLNVWRAMSTRAGGEILPSTEQGQ